MRRHVAAIAAVVAACLYLSVPAALYNFDGVACAIAVELGDLRHLAHGNHLIYGLLGYAWFSAWKAFGYAGPAVQSLQALDSIVGAAAVGAFARLLIRCGVRPVLAAAGAAGLMVSGLYWTWSLEAQVYPLGCFFLFMAAAEAAGDRPDPVRVGAWHAGAMLGHVGHAMFFPAACWLLSSGRYLKRRRDWSVLGRYAASAAVVTAAAYAAAAVLFVRPESWGEAWSWLLGSAALGVERRFQWIGGYPLEGFWLWGRVTLGLFGGGPWIGAAALAAALFGARVSWRGHRREVVAASLWLGGYAVLFTAWHPGQPVYRIPDLAPLWLLIAMGIERIAERSRNWSRIAVAGAASGIAALGALNFEQSIRPSSDPARNADLQRALWVGRSTPENAWVLVDNADQVYVPYFGHRRPLNLRYYVGREAQLGARVRSLASAQEPVFVVPGTLAPVWRDWLRSRRLTEAGRHGGEILYLVE